MRDPVTEFQAYNRDYIRTETLLAGLRENGVPVLLCQVNRRDPLRYPPTDADTGETDAALATLRHTLGESEFEREYAAGQALTTDEAIHFALHGPPEPDQQAPPGAG